MHTPGPWSVGQTRNMRNIDPRLQPMWETLVHVGDGADQGNCLAIAYLGGKGAISQMKEDIEANARLIAAAPAMFELIKKHLEDSGCDGDLCARVWHDDFRKLIRKVEGE